MEAMLGVIAPCFAEFNCRRCNAHWTSSMAWRNFGQKCKLCIARLESLMDNGDLSKEDGEKDIQDLPKEFSEAFFANFYYTCVSCHLFWKFKKIEKGMWCKGQVRQKDSEKDDKSPKMSKCNTLVFSESFREYYFQYEMSGFRRSNPDNANKRRPHRRDLCEKCNLGQCKSGEYAENRKALMDRSLPTSVLIRPTAAELKQNEADLKTEDEDTDEEEEVCTPNRRLEILKRLRFGGAAG